MKLIYFNGEVRAELIRLVLVQGGIEFEDFRFEFKDWPKIKAEGGFPFTQVPVLEVNGQKICQSRAIARYAARLAGLAGKNLEEEALADMYVSAIDDDVLENFWKCAYFEQDPEKKAELQKKFKEETVPKFLRNLDRLYESSGGDYLLGNSLTYADLAYYRMIKTVSGLVGDVSSDRLKSLYQRVAALPKIAHWEETKPKPAF
ncbi:Hematopoietic prostaglandin D synthase [Trichoplax sp. H2]|uniref:glutathione transferase n=1 Tax=Trichoplax adhaerens TaxID=10228 RepID=B3RM22_TRIAD|nr:expressed hypothetical protein [Trichoplax adhaerens]EDV29623.1 expressed hypothetical protein [Trichoplax adhaerens]RDD46616.1 Hematopoietic prostaglandin D synthase [Trichoplax sp. H2]|eukprot:XP_002108825.1 expressed hypothetical protein [Trichoplax adhaerens]